MRASKHTGARCDTPQSWDGHRVAAVVPSELQSAIGGQEDDMSTERNKRLSARFTDLFTTGDVEAAREVLAENVRFHGGSAGELTSRDQLVGMILEYRRTFEDVRSIVHDQVAEGDKVVTRWVSSGRVPEGKRYELRGITIERIENDRIAEVWMNRDDLAMMEQLAPEVRV
jgi:predicted ester cyclase